MRPIYQALGYDFPRVQTIDVKDSLWVEIDNPLSKAFAMASFWIPSIVLSCDFWISVAPFQIRDSLATLTIHNLLGLLPIKKYRREDLEALGLEKVMADLYFTVPFDMGIIEAEVKFTMGTDPQQGESVELGKVFIGEPFEVDSEAAQLARLNPEYLELIKRGKRELEG